MKVLGIVASVILIVVILLGLSVGLGLFGLEYKKFFAPRHANVDRQVFENTQSYTHGKVQDLAKKFEEHNKALSEQDRQAIRAMIRMQFAEFDGSKINSPALRQFLTNMRGY